MPAESSEEYWYTMYREDGACCLPYPVGLDSASPAYSRSLPDCKTRLTLSLQTTDTRQGPLMPSLGPTGYSQPTSPFQTGMRPLLARWLHRKPQPQEYQEYASKAYCTSHLQR